MKANQVLALVGGVAALSTSAMAQVYNNGAPDPAGFAFSSQLDTAYPFDSQMADDFVLPDDGRSNQWAITGVDWFGQWFNPGPPGNGTGFNILFYNSNAAGTSPTGGPGDPSGTAIATRVVSGNEAGAGPIFSYSGDWAASPVMLDKGVQYWIAIQSVNEFPPQWGWHESLLNTGADARFGFPLLGAPYWVDPNTTGLNDMAFALRGFKVPGPASLSLLGMAGLVAGRRRRA